MYPAEFEWTINLETLDQDYKPHSNLGFSSVSDMLQTFMGLSGYGRLLLRQRDSFGLSLYSSAMPGWGRFFSSCTKHIAISINSNKK